MKPGGALGTADRAWRGPALGIIAAGLLLYGWLWRGGPEWGGDTSSYLEPARDLADFSWDRLHFRTPGYPFFLRVVAGPGEPGSRLVLAQLGLWAAAVWSLASLLARLGLGRFGVTLFVAACWLPHLTQAADLALSESLAQSLLAMGFAALARAALLDGKKASLLAASVAFGCLALTRPVYQATAPALAALLAAVAVLPAARPSRRRLLRAAVGLPVGTVVLCGGLALLQQSRFGAPSSAAGAIALAAQVAGYVEALPPEEPVRAMLVRHRDAWLVAARHHRPEGYIFRAWPELVAHFGGDELRATRELKRLSGEIIRREPRAYLLQVWRSFGRYWEWFSSAVPGLRSRWVAAPLLLLHGTTAAIFASALASAGVALLFWWRLPVEVRRRARGFLPSSAQMGAFALAAAAVVLHMVLQCALGVGEPRYRLPSDPLVLVAVALFVAFLGRLRRRLMGAVATADGASPRSGTPPIGSVPPAVSAKATIVSRTPRARRDRA